jgi:hypothetical protein
MDRIVCDVRALKCSKHTRPHCCMDRTVFCLGGGLELWEGGILPSDRCDPVLRKASHFHQLADAFDGHDGWRPLEDRSFTSFCCAVRIYSPSLPSTGPRAASLCLLTR